MTLLLVDDNKRFRTRLASLTTGMRTVDKVLEAGNVHEAIHALQTSTPDVVILDIHMPGGSGLDVLAAAKATAPAPLVMMLTVGPSSEYRERCFALGADYFFEKSSDLTRMLKLLKKLALEHTSDAPSSKNVRTVPAAIPVKGQPQ